MREQLMKITPKYWQAVKRFGLPFGAIFLCMDYFVFRATHHGARYPWGWNIAGDVLLVFLVSALWCWLFPKHNVHRNRNDVRL
jgi:hypothetical protein